MKRRNMNENSSQYFQIDLDSPIHFFSSPHFVMQDQAQDGKPLNGDHPQRQHIQRYENQVAFVFFTYFAERQLFEGVNILAACANVLFQTT